MGGVTRQRLPHAVPTLGRPRERRSWRKQRQARDVANSLVTAEMEEARQVSWFAGDHSSDGRTDTGGSEIFPN